jgi:hypothetical protein
MMRPRVAEPLHRVLGLFLSSARADAARQALVLRGLPNDRIRLLSAGTSGGRHPRPVEADAALQAILQGATVGTAAGALAGLAGGAALAAAQFTLFISHPVLSALALMGWGASLGAAAGALAGLQQREGAVADLVRDAFGCGHVVLVVTTWTESETNLARRVLAAEMEAQAAVVPRVAPPDVAPLGRTLSAP